jgi:hypothetical protein
MKITHVFSIESNRANSMKQTPIPSIPKAMIDFLEYGRVLTTGDQKITAAE